MQRTSYISRLFSQWHGQTDIQLPVVGLLTCSFLPLFLSNSLCVSLDLSDCLFSSIIYSANECIWKQNEFFLASKQDKRRPKNRKPSTNFVNQMNCVFCMFGGQTEASNGNSWNQMTVRHFTSLEIKRTFFASFVRMKSRKKQAFSQSTYVTQ